MIFKLIVFDMDGVLVDVNSSWKLIHDTFCVNNTINLTNYLQGKYNYSEFMRRDIALWENVHIKNIKDILYKIPLMTGLNETINELKEMGYKTAIISAGISMLAERIKKETNIDYVYSNKILYDKDGILTGEGKMYVCLLNKVHVLEKLVQKLSITTRECAVIGDSVFDIPLFKVSGLSIAFNTSNEKVKKAANIIIEAKDLRKILPYFARGYEEIRAYEEV